jgi:hypothetical protein
VLLEEIRTQAGMLVSLNCAVDSLTLIQHNAGNSDLRKNIYDILAGLGHQVGGKEIPAA